MSSFPTPFGLLMHIAFKFHYIHDNGLFIRLLKRIRELAAIPVILSQKNRTYILEATGDQGELESLAQLVSTLIPQSLFLKDYTVEEAAGEHELQPLIEPNNPYRVPCCPQCQQKILQTLDPFEECSVCGFSERRITLEDLLTFTQSDAKTANELFTQLAQQLIDNNEITLPTYNGLRRFSLLTTQERDENGLLICNPCDISDSLLITQGELDTLMMIEKPTVRLKPKLKFRAEYNLHKPFYPVFFADDTITMALSTAVSSKGIEAIYCDHVPSLHTASALGHHIIVAIGRDMLPYHHSMPLKQASCCTFDGFEAFGDSGGLLMHTKPISQPCVRFVANNEPSSLSNTISFEPSHAALRSIVLEHDLQGKSLCGIYLSRTHRSQIFGFSKKIGYTPMAYFVDEMLTHPTTMLASIAQMDEAGARLVANYQKTYPQLVDKIEHSRFETQGHNSMLSRLWGMAAVVIGICDGDDIERSCEQLEATALEFNGKSGPRIDYKVIKTAIGYQIDPRLAIRSAMSFKLAGVDEYLLSFGFIDSLADFIAQQAELTDANIAINGVTLSGSLFENRQLLMRTYNALSSNYKIYRNERLSMDGANVAVGAITLGSE
ncbi:MAG TPA: hypothetical protein VFX68_07185 [Sulfuricurvum sp.]|nr:hypothetical protein [Sulfuricurvum sp.]